MLRRLWPAIIGVIAVFNGGGRAAAMGPAAARPSITILAPGNGAVLDGGSVTVRVRVVNFVLVSPVLQNPPILPGAEGHIHYLLDGRADYRPGHDMSSDTVHTWTNVPPGPHSIVAYLATSQHFQFPGTQQARVDIRVRSAIIPASVATPQPTPQQGAGIAAVPHVGGGGGAPDKPAGWSLLPPGILLLLLGGLLLFWSRMMPAAAENASSE